MYFISCNNNEQINKKLDKKQAFNLSQRTQSWIICISLCITKKERLFNTRILCGQRLFTCKFRHFKTEYGRSISVKSWNSPVVNRVQMSSVSQSSIGSSKNPWKWLILLLLQVKGLGPVVQSLDSAICWINNNPVDNYYGIQLRYPLNIFLSGW